MPYQMVGRADFFLDQWFGAIWVFFRDQNSDIVLAVNRQNLSSQGDEAILRAGDRDRSWRVTEDNPCTQESRARNDVVLIM
jgi:hypothetical protein